MSLFDVPTREEVLSATVDLVLPDECESDMFEPLPADAAYVPPPVEPAPSPFVASVFRSAPSSSFGGGGGGPSPAAAGGVAFGACLVVVLAIWTAAECCLSRRRPCGRRGGDADAAKARGARRGCAGRAADVAFALCSLIAFALGGVVVASTVQVNEHAKGVAESLSYLSHAVGRTAEGLTKAVGAAERTLLALARVAVDGNLGCVPFTDGLVDAAVESVGETAGPYFDEWRTLPGEELIPTGDKLADASAAVDDYASKLAGVMIGLSVAGLAGTSLIVARRLAERDGGRRCRCRCLLRMPGWAVAVITLSIAIVMSLSFGVGVAGLLSAAEFCSDPDGATLDAVNSSGDASPEALDALSYYLRCGTPNATAGADLVGDGPRLPFVLFTASCYANYAREYDPEDVPTLCEPDEANAAFDGEKGALANITDDVVSGASCSSIHPVYRDIVDGACVDVSRWAAAAAWAAAFMALFSMMAAVLGRHGPGSGGSQVGGEGTISGPEDDAREGGSGGGFQDEESIDVNAMATNVTGV